MPRYAASPAAERDIESILALSQEQFGEQGRLRYEALLVRAMLDVGERPERAGSQARPEIGAAVRTYHFYYSRENVPTATGRVRRPRHFLLYRIGPDGVVEIGRVLHDRMDLARHLPPRFESRVDGPAAE